VSAISPTAAITSLEEKRQQQQTEQPFLKSSVE
jgi:hypothetical protein